MNLFRLLAAAIAVFFLATTGASSDFRPYPVKNNPGKNLFVQADSDDFDDPGGDEEKNSEEEDEDEGETEDIPIGIPMRADPAKHKIIPMKHLWSSGSDIAPALSPDSRYIIFQSNRDNENRFALYETIRSGGDEWTKPKQIILDPKATFEGQPFFSGRDGYIYYTSICDKNYRQKDKVDIAGDIWFTRYLNGKWNEPVHLKAPVNTEYAELTPWVSYDSRRLYFSSNRPGGYGGYDIWASDIEDGQWGEPFNLGPEINSGGDEIYPRIHPDNSVLYFSSNRADGVGGFDIYLSRRSGSRFKKAQNAGSFINTRSNELINSIPASSKFVIFSRGDLGEEKIYKINPIPEFMKPSSVVIARIIVLEKGTDIQKPFEVEVKNQLTQSIILQKNHEPESSEPFKDEKPEAGGLLANYFKPAGLFISLPVPGNYNLFITSKNYLFVDENIEVKQFEEDEIKRIYYLTPLVKGASIALRDINFYGDEAVMKEESKPNLLRVARYLSTNKGIDVELDGHTSMGSGTEQSRMTLSLARAEAVKKALVEYGIDEKRITTNGFGATKPLHPHGSANAAKNRRVEFTVRDLAFEEQQKQLKELKKKKKKKGKKKKG